MAAFVVASACKTAPPPPLSAKPTGDPITIRTPLGLPPVPVPASNQPTAATVALGEKLYFSKELSSDGTIACASCHDPKKGFTDNSAFSSGVGGKKGGRSAPPARNAAYFTTLFWDGRASSLEEQAAGPIQNAIEMASTRESVERSLSASAEWRRAFADAFGAAPDGRSPVTLERVTAAIASYERTLVRANSPFDRFLYGNDSRALTPSARRGLDVFREPAKANCVACHQIGKEYALFTDNRFHNIGIGVDAEGNLKDQGRYEVTKQDGDRGAFRTPSLRDIALTAPYMHDGSLKTLKEVVDFYVGGGNANDHRDPLIRPLTHLTRQDREDLVAFLESLTGTDSPSVRENGSQ